MSEFIPMNRPSLGEEEINAVSEVLRSGWITTGPRCAEFERRFAAHTGAVHALGLSSATGGMHLLLKGLGVGPGDEVITPSLTFASTVNQIALLGAVPVFADVDYGTLLMPAEEVARLRSPRTKAVIPVHFAGAPADLDGIAAAAGDIPVIEDAAHAAGTYYRGRHIGRDNPAVYSFHPIKNMTTGEGGMLTLDDDGLDRKLRLLKFHGIERDAWKRYGKASDPTYDIAEPGYKYNMTDIQAVLGLCQLSRLEDFNARRAAIVGRYLAELSGLPGLDLPAVPDWEHTHAWHLFVVKVTGMERGAFMAALAEHEVGYGLHFPPCHRLRYVRERYGEVRLPETERAAERIISLPLYPDMTDEQVGRVIAVVREILG